MSIYGEINLNESHCSECRGKIIWVESYTKKDGTIVKKYWKHKEKLIVNLDH